MRFVPPILSTQRVSSRKMIRVFRIPLLYARHNGPLRFFLGGLHGPANSTFLRIFTQSDLRQYYQASSPKDIDLQLWISVGNRHNSTLILAVRK